MGRNPTRAIVGGMAGGYQASCLPPEVSLGSWAPLTCGNMSSGLILFEAACSLRVLALCTGFWAETQRAAWLHFVG